MVGEENRSQKENKQTNNPSPSPLFTVLSVGAVPALHSTDRIRTLCSVVTNPSFYNLTAHVEECCPVFLKATSPVFNRLT